MRKINQKGFSVIEIMLLVVIVGLIGFILYVVYQAQTTSQSSTTQNTSPSTSGTPQPATSKSIDKSTYTLTLPAGWAEATTAPNAYVGSLMSAVETGGSYNYYTDASGNYFAVSVSPSGRGFEANETWQLTNTTNGYTVGKKLTCTAGQDFCTPANVTEYRVGLKTDGSKLKEHTYFFFAGNSSKKTDVDTSVFQKIAESFVAK